MPVVKINFASEEELLRKLPKLTRGALSNIIQHRGAGNNITPAFMQEYCAQINLLNIDFAENPRIDEVDNPTGRSSTTDFEDAFLGVSQVELGGIGAKPKMGPKYQQSTTTNDVEGGLESQLVDLTSQLSFAEDKEIDTSTVRMSKEMFHQFLQFQKLSNGEGKKSDQVMERAFPERQRKDERGESRNRKSIQDKVEEVIYARKEKNGPRAQVKHKNKQTRLQTGSGQVEHQQKRHTREHPEYHSTPIRRVRGHVHEDSDDEFQYIRENPMEDSDASSAEDVAEEEEPRRQGQRSERAAMGPKNLKFAGNPDQDWHSFKEDFKTWIELEGIEGFRRKMFALSNALEGRAKQHFCCLRNSVDTFSGMLREMKAQFGKTKEEKVDAAMVELQGVKQGENESLNAFEDRVVLLGYQAFPDGPANVRIRQTVLAVTHGLRDRNLRKDAMKQNFKNLTEMRTSLVRCQKANEVNRLPNNYSKGWNARGVLKDQAKQVQWASEESSDEDEDRVCNVSFAQGTKEGNVSELHSMKKQLRGLEEKFTESLAGQKALSDQMERLEKMIRSFQPGVADRSRNRSRTPPPPSREARAQIPGSPGYKGCYHCNALDHLGRDCPKA